MAALLLTGCGSALHDAIRQADSEQGMKPIAQGADVNARDQGRSALIEAAAQNDTEVATALIARGAQVDYIEKRSGQVFARPVFYAVSFGNVQLTQALLDAGAPADSRGWQNM